MGSTKLLSCKQRTIELLKGIQDLWENSLFFDFTLKVEDDSIAVHKSILASCSGYFRAMFNSSMKESSKISVELKGLKASAVKCLINYIYTGDIELSTDTLEDVLSAAHYLQIHSAIVLCSDYLLSDMTWDSVSYVLHFARMYALDDVEKKVETFMLANFSQMPVKVVESIGNQALKLTASNALCVNSEYLLFEKLMLFKPILSEDEFYEALSQVRFPLMSKDELEKVSSTGLMTTRLSHLMDEAWEYHKDVMRQPLLQTDRTQVRSDKAAMVLADNSCITGVYENQSLKEIRTKAPISPLQVLHGYHIREIISVENFLYVCQKQEVPDGSDFLGFFRYDPRFNSWQELRPLLKTNRRDFSLVACGMEIFAIGGSLTRTLEIYDIQTNKWRFGADINYDGFHRAGIALGDTIHVCGGEQLDEDIEENVSVDTLACYDPENDTWQLKESMEEARSRHQIVASDGKLFVFAGTDGDFSPFKCSVEYYTPDLNQWTLINDALPYKIDGVCSIGSDIYILKREERANDINPETMDTMTVFFKKFNLETLSTEREGYLVKLEKFDVLFKIYPAFKCSTLMLPFKLR